MQTWTQIERTAAKRKGGAAKLRAELPTAKSRAALARVKDSALLSAFAKSVFQSGFVWKVVEAKWPSTTEAFDGFEPAVVAAWSDRRLDALSSDERVIRNRVKLTSVRDNARLLLELAEEQGSAARFVAGWPGDDIVGLWELLRKRGSRLGGNTGPMALRSIGKDTFIFTDYVVRALRAQGVLGAKTGPTSKKALAQVQEAFNKWGAESGRKLCEMSKVLACSLD